MRGTILAAVLVLGAASAALADPAGPSGAGGGDDPICTDRPSKSTGACTIGQGHIQIESGLVDGIFQREGGVTTDTTSYFAPAIKYGVTPTLDAEVDLTAYTSVRTHAAGQPSNTVGGFGDLYFRVKDNLYGGNDGALSIAIIPYVKAPTARDGIGNGAWEGGAILPVIVKLDDTFTLSFDPEVDILKDNVGDGRHAQTIQVVNLGVQLPANVAVSGEIWGQWNFDPMGETRQASFDLSAAWIVHKTLQFDGGVNFGLSRDTPGAEVYAGISKRF